MGKVKELLKVKEWKGEKVKRWLRPFKVKGWKGEKMAAPIKLVSQKAGSTTYILTTL